MKYRIQIGRATFETTIVEIEAKDQAAANEIAQRACFALYNGADVRNGTAPLEWKREKQLFTMAPSS